jgi:hypothetical protein
MFILPSRSIIGNWNLAKHELPCADSHHFDHTGTTRIQQPLTNSNNKHSLSGGDDDAHGNQTDLEAALNAGNAIWEITRYSGVVHGFTKWDSVEAYSLKADYRSWESMLTAFQELMPIPVAIIPPSDSPSSVPSTTPAPSGPTVLPVSGAPSSIPTILPVATESSATAAPVPTSSSADRNAALFYQSPIATASLSLCIMWTFFF